MITVLLVIGAIVSSVVSYRARKRSIVIPEYQRISTESTPPDCKHILEYLTPEDRRILESALEKAEPKLSQAAYIILYCIPDTYIGDVTKKCIQRGIWLPTKREAEMIINQIIYGHQKDEVRAILKKFCPSSLP